MGAAIHTLHVVLAGVWLGGVVFTTTVVSPALKAMKWSEAEQVGVRSAIGKQYARLGILNLLLLLLFAAFDGLLKGFSVVYYTEYALLATVFGLVAIYGGYFGRRLARLAAAERRHRECSGGPRLPPKAPQGAAALLVGLLGNRPH